MKRWVENALYKQIEQQVSASLPTKSLLFKASKEKADHLWLPVSNNDDIVSNKDYIDLFYIEKQIRIISFNQH